MNQIDRITNMEKDLDIVIGEIELFKKSLMNFEKVQKDINRISKYYGSKVWYKDKEDYENNKIHNIKAGILGEDYTYDMLEDNREIAIKMLEIATKILK